MVNPNSTYDVSNLLSRLDQKIDWKRTYDMLVSELSGYKELLKPVTTKYRLIVSVLIVMVINEFETFDEFEKAWKKNFSYQRFAGFVTYRENIQEQSHVILKEIWKEIQNNDKALKIISNEIHRAKHAINLPIDNIWEGAENILAHDIKKGFIEDYMDREEVDYSFKGF